MKKLLLILSFILIMGLSFSVTSCSKEKTCKCTTTSSNGAEISSVTVTIKEGKCSAKNTTILGVETKCKRKW